MRPAHIEAPTPAKSEFWAVEDVTFDVRQGEVLGVVGRNGAGKSTLLKILCRITRPTKGRAVVRGRVGSLLEVGTGFHQELTGRENVYLNGAVLGMSRADIRARFDEIVEFSGVEKFLDTPVKRYSSGMQVRLAFAVAAHLEPEILVIDEVLAVGDAEFQKKCIGKMRVAAGDGRTVVFVSHNMVAVEALCDRAILLERGRLEFEGTPNDVLNRYIQGDHELSSAVDLRQARGRVTGMECVIERVEIRDASGVSTARVGAGSRIEAVIEYQSSAELVSPEFALLIESPQLGRVIHLPSNVTGRLPATAGRKGLATCVIDPLPLQPGQYSLGLGCRAAGRQVDLIDGAMLLEVFPADYYGTGRLPEPTNSAILANGVWSVSCDT